MCGIFGCLGSDRLIDTTINGLSVLEYRGYDSTGIAYTKPDGQFTVTKAVGDIKQLIKKVTDRPATALCLGHTRWATNGGVCETNSHPHLSANRQIAVVHNGIIENYLDCKKLLSQHHIKLQTTVDTEVIPNILYLLKHNKHNIHQFLQGHYVFCAGYAGSEPELFIAKKGSLPLYIGQATDTIYVTSDTLALPDTVTQIIALDDLDTCTITPQNIVFYHNGQLVTKTWQPFTQNSLTTDKGQFATFMEKEIHEIPTVMQRIVQTYPTDPLLGNKLRDWQQLLGHTACVHICGCGTSYHAALILAKLFEKYRQVRAKAHISSEFTADALLGNDLAIVISQSGETADTLACMNILATHHVPVIALCNVTRSTIAKQSQICFPLLCGPEIAVASTKVFCAALLVGCYLINRFTNNDFNALPQLASTAIKAARTSLSLPDKQPQKIFFIGKGLDYFLALEAALKVKEVTYSHCEGYPANELKHGPLSMVDDKTLSIVFQSDTTANAVAEISARGGQVSNLPPFARDNPLGFIAQIIPAQIFALDLANKLGINPDRPRNLAKSVTVL